VQYKYYFEEGDKFSHNFKIPGRRDSIDLFTKPEKFQIFSLSIFKKTTLNSFLVIVIYP